MNNDCCETYALRVQELESEGLTTSDAQAIADTEHVQMHEDFRVIAALVANYGIRLTI